MSESLQDIKRSISQQYLGRSGIHGVGLRAGEDAVVIYVAPDSTREQELLLEDIRRAAAPHGVVTVQEAAPRLM